MYGRKIVILGDTCDSSQLIPLAYDADILTHECTFAASESLRAKRAFHSTSTMAGLFASRIRAKNLLLTHFSVRYNSEIPSLTGLFSLTSLLKEAQSTAANVKVFIATDFSTFKI